MLHRMLSWQSSQNCYFGHDLQQLNGIQVKYNWINRTFLPEVFRPEENQQKVQSNWWFYHNVYLVTKTKKKTCTGLTYHCLPKSILLQNVTSSNNLRTVVEYSFKISWWTFFSYFSKSCIMLIHKSVWARFKCKPGYILFAVTDEVLRF